MVLPQSYVFHLNHFSKLLIHTGMQKFIFYKIRENAEEPANPENCTDEF